MVLTNIRSINWVIYANLLCIATVLLDISSVSQRYMYNSCCGINREYGCVAVMSMDVWLRIIPNFYVDNDAVLT